MHDLLQGAINWLVKLAKIPETETYNSKPLMQECKGVQPQQSAVKAAAVKSAFLGAVSVG